MINKSENNVMKNNAAVNLYLERKSSLMELSEDAR